MSWVLPANAREIQIVTEDWPPFSYEENGKITGFSVELVKALQTETGIQGKISIYPWKRALYIATEEENTLLMTPARTAKREKLFHWVGPIAPRSVSLIKLKSRTDIKIDTLEDAKKYIIGAVLGFATTNQLIAQGFENNTHIEQVPTPVMNVRKLFNDRVELILMLESEFVWISKRHGFDHNNAEIALIIPQPVKELYIAFSKNTSQGIVDDFRDAFEKLKQNGTHEKLKQIFLE